MELDNNQEINDPSRKKSFLEKYWWIGLVLVVVMIFAGFVITKMVAKKQNPTSMSNSVSSPAIIPTIPKTSASAITSPPSSMVGINTHTEVYGQGADPNMITLGPKIDSYSRSTPYPDKRGFEFELASKTPLLAPMDMTLTGFQNHSTKSGIGADGQKYTPFNDLMLSFESDSPDWPGVVIVLYHLYTSPLILGHYQNPDCGDVEVGAKKNTHAEGYLYFSYNDSVTVATGNAKACQALIGREVKRGELIGYAGNVGEHSFVSFAFKVPDKSINPTVKKGNRNLHWVQPASFFYWKSYRPGATFPSGVLAYPFESDGYQLPAEQRDANFKYTSTK